MAEELCVAQKTIRRDLQLLREVGFPLEKTVGERGKRTWRLKPSANSPPMGFAFDEAIALYLGRRFLEPLAGTVFWSAAQRAFRKIRALLTPAALEYIERFAEIFHQTTVGISDYSQKAEVIDQLMVGIEDGHAVFLTYQSLQATESVTYDVYPYGFAYHRGSLYLIGHSPERNEIRHWKVDRIEDAGVTQFPFQRPEDFDLQDHLSKSFGIYDGDGDIRVSIRFSPTVARYVQEKTWHPSQSLTKEKDGSLIAEFRLSNTEEIKRWVLSFGRHAEVLEPGVLRKGIVSEFESAQQNYNQATEGRRRKRHVRND